MKKILLGIAVFLTALAGGYGINELGAGVNTGERTIMSEVATTTVGAEFLTNDYRNIVFNVANTAASGTLKFACSPQEDVDFATAAGVTNRWDYVQVVDREDGTSYDGDVGWTQTNNSEVREFVANIDGAYYCTAIWTRTNGTSTIKMRLFNNL